MFPSLISLTITFHSDGCFCFQLCVTFLYIFRFPLQEVFSPPQVPPHGGGTELLLIHLWRDGTYPGVQGEGEAWSNIQGECKWLTLACQRLTEIQALGSQSWAFSSSCSLRHHYRLEWHLETCSSTGILISSLVWHFILKLEDQFSDTSIPAALPHPTAYCILYTAYCILFFV